MLKNNMLTPLLFQDAVLKYILLSLAFVLKVRIIRNDLLSDVMFLGSFDVQILHQQINMNTMFVKGFFIFRCCTIPCDVAQTY